MPSFSMHEGAVTLRLKACLEVGTWLSLQRFVLQSLDSPLSTPTATEPAAACRTDRRFPRPPPPRTEIIFELFLSPAVAGAPRRFWTHKKAKRTSISVVTVFLSVFMSRNGSKCLYSQSKGAGPSLRCYQLLKQSLGLSG